MLIRGKEDEVVVTGMGCVTPIGDNVACTWKNLINGKSGIGPNEILKENTLVSLAAAINTPIKDLFAGERVGRNDRFAQLALVATSEAWKDSHVKEEYEQTKMAVSVGTGIGGLHTLTGSYDVFKEKGARRVSPMTIPMLMPNSASSTIAINYGVRGGVYTPVSACASGADGILNGFRLISSGGADLVICGGTESVIHPFPVSAFSNMMAMSKAEKVEESIMPFDVKRNGFILGEGAAILILEKRSSAEKRGAKIYASIIGGASTSDAHNIAQPEPTGRDVERAIVLALNDAAIDAKKIAHINAHATGTPQGDIAEANALMKIFNKVKTGYLPVSATKASIGHALGGAGAIESIFTIKALIHNLAPPNINLRELDPKINLDIVGDRAEEFDGDIAMNDSFGFGGHNVVLIFKKYV